MIKLFYVLIFLSVSLADALIAQTNWTFDDAHSNLQFSVTNLMVAEIEGSIVIREARLTTPNQDYTDATIYILADVNTIDTDNDARDEHLRSPDFFDAAKYPDLTFQSTTFKKVGENKYSVTGNLTFHGITKSVTMDVIAAEAIRPYDSKAVVGFKASGVIKRSDFDISASTPSAILSDEVQIKGNAIFVKE